MSEKAEKMDARCSFRGKTNTCFYETDTFVRETNTPEGGKSLHLFQVSYEPVLRSCAYRFYGYTVRFVLQLVVTSRTTS